MNSLSRWLMHAAVPAQALRLRRLRMATTSYVFTFSMVLAFWWLGYLSSFAVASYLAIVVALNIGFYAVIRSDLNLRFADPSLTLAQICLAMGACLYVMYFATQARGVFLLLAIAGVLYGLFQFRARQFYLMTGLLLGGYSLLIVLLMINRPDQLVLQVELLQLLALAAGLVQFSGLGTYIARLRDQVKQKNAELAGRNGELETALQRIGELAVRDELTGVYNRRYLMERIGIEKQRRDRSGSAFSICILDVDFFKKINDCYGHLAGDEVLREIARTASEALRQTDYFGRYGGEEFALVVTDTEIEGALITAERVRQRVQNLRFPHISPELRVTISTGIADARANEDTGATFNRADQALYRAKEGGRNRCELAQTD